MEFKYKFKQIFFKTQHKFAYFFDIRHIAYIKY